MSKLVGFIVGVFAWSSLAAPPADLAARTQAQLLSYVPDAELLVVRGKLDVANLYDSVVMVQADPTIRTGQEGLCSGTLIAPDLVLTAAHCSCAELPRREDGTSQMDATRCESSVKVGISYNVVTENKETSTTTWVKGTFKPNKDFLVKYDAAHRLVSVTADIAVVRLSEPVEGVKIALFPDEYPQKDAEVVMVGFGADEFGIMGRRKFGNTKIHSATPEQLELSGDGVKAWKGDSGGALFADGPDGKPRLVGVISYGSAVIPTALMSTFYYRAFCAAELQQSVTAIAASPPEARTDNL